MNKGTVQEVDLVLSACLGEDYIPERVEIRVK